MKKWKTFDGYMTLEATCLMPIILFCLLFIIYLGFWEYDKCLVEQDVFSTMLRGSNAINLSNEELNQYLSGNVFAENKYLYLGDVQEEISVSKEEMKFQWKGAIKTILNNNQILGGINAFVLQGFYQVQRYDPISFIRNCRKVEHGFDRICK